MNIKETSWHYRILNYLDMLKNPRIGRESLCPYFWKVAFCVTVLPLTVLASIWVLTMPFWWMFFDAPLPIVILIASGEIVALLYILKTLVSIRHEDEIAKGTREPVNEEPSLLRAWLSAKHRKVCPLIDFVGGS